MCILSIFLPMPQIQSTCTCIWRLQRWMGQLRWYRVWVLILRKWTIQAAYLWHTRSQQKKERPRTLICVDWQYFILQCIKLTMSNLVYAFLGLHSLLHLALRSWSDPCPCLHFTNSGGAGWNHHADYSGLGSQWCLNDLVVCRLLFGAPKMFGTSHHILLSCAAEEKCLASPNCIV